MSVPYDEMRRRLGADAPNDSLDDIDRRGFVKLLAASLALAGLEGCTRMPASNILPYVDQPELTPGVPQYYATSMVLDGYATGLLVESHEGRPTKVEGHPQHPASLGAAGVFEQASVLQLYDPHRARTIRRGPAAATWDAFGAAFGPDALAPQLGAGGAGLFLLLEPTSSPLEGELLDRLTTKYPAARVHFYNPLALSGDAVIPQYGVRDADVILAIDSNFVAEGPFHLRYAREFAERRRPESARGMNRCYAVESSVTVTGAAADHRFALRPHEIVPALERLLSAIRSGAPSGGDWIATVARDLHAHAGRSLVVAGSYGSPRTRTLAFQINEALDNIGRTMWFTASPLIGAGDARHSLASLVEALRAGDVKVLICAGGNPSYASAGAYDLPSLIRRVHQSAYLGLYENETARDCTWMVPAAHFLETWSDARAYDGTLSIVQPLIDPISGGRSVAEVLSALLGAPERPYDLLRDSWARSGRLETGDGFEDGWRTIVSRGVLDGSAFPRVPAPVAARPETSPSSSSGVEILLRPHPRVRDGSFGNNGWLQELPDPITTLTWENAAHVSPATAQRLEIETGTVVEVAAAGRVIRLPAVVVSGHADETVTLHFGYGREGAEAIARGRGTSVYPLWTGQGYTIARAALARAVGTDRRDLAMTQRHHTLETSTPARTITLDRLGTLERPRAGEPLTLYAAPTSLPDGRAPHQWAMTIDLGACIGCGACTVACQAENNVPVVGREQVLLGREMHWLRIDWYAPRNAAEPLARPQPMLCQQCQKAPCEYVCPVEATVHSRDGLNEMIYNRCVGTRFCSNNCPYKVRRFNWFDFNRTLTPTERLVKNPDVTVRERGVMEKCTFCVQRIREAEIAARNAGRPLRGSSIQTACQQACPTQAIVLGSLDERDSPMARGRASTRAYTVLDDLGTEPRVTYLTRVRNPNPDLERRT